MVLSFDRPFFFRLVHFRWGFGRYRHAQHQLIGLLAQKVGFSLHCGVLSRIVVALVSIRDQSAINRPRTWYNSPFVGQKMVSWLSCGIQHHPTVELFFGDHHQSQGGYVIDTAAIPHQATFGFSALMQKLQNPRFDSFWHTKIRDSQTKNEHSTTKTTNVRIQFWGHYEGSHVDNTRDTKNLDENFNRPKSHIIQVHHSGFYYSWKPANLTFMIQILIAQLLARSNICDFSLHLTTRVGYPWLACCKWGDQKLSGSQVGKWPTPVLSTAFSTLGGPKIKAESFITCLVQWLHNRHVRPGNNYQLTQIVPCVLMRLVFIRCNRICSLWCHLLNI